MQKIWFITGISSGLGEALAQAVMQKGDVAVGTFRQEAQAQQFTEQSAGKGLGLVVDVTKSTQLEQAFQIIFERYGRLDVLVNNAGIGFAGAIEEATLEEAKHIFEVNLWGAMLATQLALPIFRAQQSGHIFQLSSGAGLRGTAGFGIYNASKFALEGLSEALADEVKPFGVRITIVNPGPFRTKFAGSSLILAQKNLPEYDATAGLFRKRLEQINNTQEGSPEKAAQIIVETAYSENPPLRLPLGKIVLGAFEAKIKMLQTDLDNGRAVAESAVF
jgi:NAD(P)-dependent dehydrogenase (short-subunit alcohol dehydrogenase family)